MSPTVEFWHTDGQRASAVGGWADLWQDDVLGGALHAAFDRLADPELYDLDGVANHPDRDADVMAELQRLHLRDMNRKGLTPAEVFRAIRAAMIDGFGDSDDGAVLYGLLLQERWVLQQLRAGWSTKRLAQTVGLANDQVAQIIADAGSELRASRAHGRAARLRRVARLAPVIARDGSWDFARYRAELDKVLGRVGLSYVDLPDDVVYLN